MADISKIRFKGVEYNIKPLMDAEPTENSINAVQSGGVRSALDGLQAEIPDIDDTLTQAGQAADAKETGDKITALAEEENIKFFKIPYSVTYTGRWATSGTGYLIPVKPGDILELENTNRASYYAVLKSKGNYVSGGDVDFATGYTSVLTFTTKRTVAIPPDGAYVWLYRTASGTDYTPTTFTINGYDYLKSTVEHIAELENFVQPTMTSINALSTNINAFSTTFCNMFDIAGWNPISVLDWDIRPLSGSTGEIDTYEGAKTKAIHSGFFKVGTNGRIILTSGYEIRLFVYASDKTYQSYSVIRESSDVTLDATKYYRIVLVHGSASSILTANDITLDEYYNVKVYQVSDKLAKLDNLINNTDRTPGEYGIKILADGTVQRYGDAVGLENDYVVGSTYINGQRNDFDTIEPWCSIRTCNIKKNTFGQDVITYSDEAGFKRDGTNGDVMVEIPKFYTKRVQNTDGTQVILISSVNRSGYVLEPAFVDSVTGDELDKIYVGAYMTGAGAALNSVSGIIPITNVPFETFKTRGEMCDFVTLNAIWKLFAVEFGLIDTSSVFGGLSDLLFNDNAKANETAQGVNTVQIKGTKRVYCLKVGSIITVSDTTNVVQNRKVTSVGDVTTSGGYYYRSVTFDGEPVNVTQGVTNIYCTPQTNGETDALVYHTGRTATINGTTIDDFVNNFRYRGIEGLWGNVSTYIDGIIVKSLKAYWSNLQGDYGDVTKCKMLNFAVPLQNSYMALPNCIKTMGVDFRYPEIMFPSELTTMDGGYYNDGFYSMDTTGPSGETLPADTEFIGNSSMAWDGSTRNGMFTLRFWSRKTSASVLYGTRMIKRTF